MNVAIIIGNLVEAPSIKQVGTTNLVSMTVATSEGQMPTEYHKIKHFTQYVDKFADFTVGDLIHVDGRVESRSYEVEGNKRWVTEINAKKITRLQGKKTDW